MCAGDDDLDVPDPEMRPAFYSVERGIIGDWWTLLHPPYTIWHLSYIAIGACLAPHLHVLLLAGNILAFFFAMGIAAHALDELQGRPLRTAISDRALWAATVISFVGTAVMGALALREVGIIIVPLGLLGAVLVVGYNLELFGGRLHTDVSFALAWGTFPTVFGAVVQSQSLRPAYLLAGAAAYSLSRAQRDLSLRARAIRRRLAVTGTVTDGSVSVQISSEWMLGPIESSLRALCWGIPLLSVAMVLAHIA